MTIYNVSGNVTRFAPTEETALKSLSAQAARADFDLTDERTYHVGAAAGEWVASGLIAGLFEAPDEDAARERFLNLALERALLLPKDIVVFTSENLPEGYEEWVR